MASGRLLSSPLVILLGPTLNLFYAALAISLSLQLLQIVFTTGASAATYSYSPKEPPAGYTLSNGKYYKVHLTYSNPRI